MPRSIKIPYRNHSPYGWWIASYIERFEWKSEDRKNTKRRCLAYENTVLIKAPNREVAFKKAQGIQNDYSRKWSLYGDPPGRPGRWVFEGLTSLLAVHEEIEDGAEILWRVHSNRSVNAMLARVKNKAELETFID